MGNAGLLSLFLRCSGGGNPGWSNMEKEETSRRGSKIGLENTRDGEPLRDAE